MKETYYAGVLKIDKDWLSFPNRSQALKLSQISDMDIIWKPKRKILLPAFLWFLAVCCINTLKMDSSWIFLVCFFVFFGGIIYLIDSIKFNLKETMTALQINMTSGKSILLCSKDKVFLERMKVAILKAIQSKEEKVEINLNNSGIINVAEQVYVGERYEN